MTVPNYFRYHAKAGDLGTTPTFEGRSAEHEHGVEFNCRWQNAFDGFSVHGRRLARALDSAGVPVKLATQGPVFVEDLEPKMRAEVERLFSREVGVFVAKVTHTLPHEGVPEQILARYLSDSKGSLSMEQAEALNRRRILSTVFEQQRITIRRARTLSRFGAIWVATNKDRNMLVEAGVPLEQVDVIHVPFEPEDKLVELRGRRHLPGPVRFYHIGKWEPRKDQHRIIGAFLCAFTPKDQATLYMKTSDRAPDFGGGTTDYYPPTPAESMRIWLAYDRVKQNGWTIDLVKQRLFLIRGEKGRSELLSLHRTSDVYVTLSHGEGYDLPAFEAKLAGNRMIYVPSGGPQEFATIVDYPVKPSGTVDAHPFYRWGEGATWLSYELEAAVEKFRMAQRFALENPVRDSGMPTEQFTPEFVGREMRGSIERLLARSETEACW